MYKNKNYHKHVVSVLVYNKYGVLNKITNLFKRRGYNIESISAGKAEKNGMVRLTIVVCGDDRIIEQVEKQLYKVLETVKVTPIHPNQKVIKELALIKIKANSERRSEIIQMVEIFRANIVDAGLDGFIIEITGNKEKIDSFINLIDANNIIEIARTGAVALNRWSIHNS